MLVHARGTLHLRGALIVGQAAIAEKLARLKALGHDGPCIGGGVGLGHSGIQHLGAAQRLHRVGRQHVLAGLHHRGDAIGLLVQCLGLGLLLRKLNQGTRACRSLWRWRLLLRLRLRLCLLLAQQTDKGTCLLGVLCRRLLRLLLPLHELNQGTWRLLASMLLHLLLGRLRGGLALRFAQAGDKRSGHF